MSAGSGTQGLERLLIVGLGSIGQRHARLARSLVPGVQLAALRHRAGAEADGVVLDRSFTSMADALQFRPQAAVIANPASHHLDAALELVRAGVHLLVEKPLAASPRGVQALIDACRARGVVLMTGYNLRFLPSLQHFRELLAQQRVGRLASVRAEIGQFLPAWRPAVDYRRNVSAQAALGGGVLLELSHEIDYLRWLFGEVRAVSAVQSRQSSLEIDVADTAHLVLEFAAPAGQGALLASLNMDFIRHDTTRTCTAIGATGSLRWNAVTGAVEVFEQGASAWQCLFAQEVERDESYVREWHNFLACIAGSGTPLVSGEDGLAVLRIVAAAEQSSATRAAVFIDAMTGGA